MPLVRSFLVGLSLAFVLLSARRVDACDCGSPSIQVVPDADVRAPLNTHLWVFNSPREGHYRLKSDGGAIELSTKRFAARGERGEGYQEKVQVVDELVPLQPLSPSTRYELIHEGKETSVVSTITTAELRDDTAPRWKGATGLQLAESIHAPEACKIGQPSATVSTHSAEDDGSPRAPLLLAAYSKNTEAPDYRPVTLHRWDGKTLLLSGGTLCSPRNFDFPKPLVKTKLVLKVLDLAGNESAEHALDIVGPLSHWDRQLLARADKLELARASNEARDDGWLQLAFLLTVLGALVAVVVLRDQKS